VFVILSLDSLSVNGEAVVCRFADARGLRLEPHAA
jgi:hypothetical protein